MSFLIYGFCIAAFVLVILLRRRCYVYSPGVMSAIVWMAVFLTGLVAGKDYYPITNSAFIAWIIWFIATSFIYIFFGQTQFIPASKKIEIKIIPIDYSLFLLGMIFWLAYRIRMVGISGPDHFLLNLRLSSVGLAGYEPLGVIARFYPIIFALFLFENVNASLHNRLLRFLLWGWMLLYAFATMGKFSILTPILAWICIQGISGKFKIKYWAIVVPATILLMTGVHFYRDQEGVNSGLSSFISLYVYSPLVALGYAPIDVLAPFGFYTLRFFYALGYALGISGKPSNVILEFIKVPVETNVYTVMQPYFMDFGFIGVGFGAILFALFFAVLYRLACKKRGAWLALYSGLVIAIVGQFIGDLFLTAISANLQLAISIALIYLYVSKDRNAS